MIHFISPTMRPVLCFLVLLMSLNQACTSAVKNDSLAPSASPNSAAYQLGVQRAFAELNQRQLDRSPASENDPEHAVKATFAANFSKTQRFRVLVFPKLMSLGTQHRGQTSQIVYGKTPTRFEFQIDKISHCAAAEELVPEDKRNTCVQVEIRPLVAGKGQYVRIFMNPDYRVFGLSYHDYDSELREFKKARKKVKWDPSEPLSSELLSLAREVVPLDLPLHASNAFRSIQQNIVIGMGSRKGENCQAVTYIYKNTYGSLIKADWCISDPWPSVVETNRYAAILEPAKSGAHR